MVPTTHGKLIQEHWGNSTRNSEISIAHMIAPPHWSKPHQTTEWNEPNKTTKKKEVTNIIREKKQFKKEREIVVLEAGQKKKKKKGARIRYSNPFEEECGYLAICLPAFSMDLVNREE